MYPVTSIPFRPSSVGPRLLYGASRAGSRSYAATVNAFGTSAGATILEAGTFRCISRGPLKIITSISSSAGPLV